MTAAELANILDGREYRQEIAAAEEASKCLEEKGKRIRRRACWQTHPRG
mgnify:CR=1 FL=1